MGYLVEAFNKIKHLLQNTVPGDVLDNPKKYDSRPASRATIFGQCHDIQHPTVYIYIYIYRGSGNAWLVLLHCSLRRV